MEETLKQVLMSGQDAEQWHKNKIRNNNASWFVVVLLFAILWIGSSAIQHTSQESIKSELKSREALIQLQQKQIDTLQSALDAAFFITDFKIKK